MSDDLKITTELESEILRWLTYEVVSLIRRSERRGTPGIHFLTKLKLQKLLYMVIEDCEIDLTRAWYMYGGVVCAPFDISSLSHSFYNRQETLSDTDLSSLEQRLGSSKMSFIKNTLAEIFPDVFFKAGRGFLLDFYEERAPERFQPIYRTFQDYVNLYTSIMNPERAYDVKSLKLLPSYDPWHQVHRLQGYLSEFHIEVAKVIVKDLFQMVVDFSDLMDRVVVNVAWKRHQEEEISSNELQILLNLENVFENTAWKLVANHIAIETVTGIRGDEMKKRYQNEQIEITTKLATEIRNQLSFLKTNNLLPKASILKEYFETKYGDMFREVVGTESVR